MPFRLRTQIAPVRKVPMFGTKSGLRKFAAIVSISAMSIFGLGPVASAAENYSTTVSFLAKAFGADKKKVVLYDAFQEGITLEAMLQLKSGGKSFVQQLPAIQYNLTNASAPIGLSAKNAYTYKGYLFNSDVKKSIKPGLAGKWLFVSEALDASNLPLRNAVLKKIKSQLSSSNGTISTFDDANASYIPDNNVFDYAWLALGLNSYQEHSLANKVVQRMLELQNSDGSFGTDSNSLADATGIALQAINYFQNYGSSAEDKKRAAAEKLAIKYLKASAISASEESTVADHWQAFGEDSVNATSYAMMGLKAAAVSSKTLAPYALWLKSNLLPQLGGFTTSFSAGAPDVYATAQSLVALQGKSYLDLLPR